LINDSIRLDTSTDKNDLKIYLLDI
jgi:hypothetical protein